MRQILEEALRETLRFLGNTIQFIIGLIGVIAVTCLSLSGEILDELTTYKESGPFPWLHVAKVMIPPTSVAVIAYIQHRKSVADAMNSPSPGQRATVVKQ